MQWFMQENISIILMVLFVEMVAKKLLQYLMKKVEDIIFLLMHGNMFCLYYLIVIFIRLSKIKKMNLEANTSSRVNLAVWFSMRPAWKSLKKIFKMNQKLPFTYIQSQQDVYYKVNKFDVEKIKKNSNRYNNLILVKKGYHLLSLDQHNNDQIIWKSINKMLEDK